MIPILDFQQRSLTGPVMKSDEFDLALVRKVRQLVAKHGIKYNPGELIVDDGTADAVFQAGVEMLADVGLYNGDSQRVIKYTWEEIEQIAREYREDPPKHTFGRGQDQFTIEYRTGEDTRPPVLGGQATGAIEQDVFVPYVQSVAQEESVKSFGSSGGVASVDGLVPKAGTLTEISCAVWEQRALLEAVRRAGRPDMHLGVISTASTVGGTLACLGPGLREPHNTQIGIHIIPEQKIDWTRLLLAYLCEQRGIEPWTSAMSVVGGLCGGPAGAAVGLVANLLGQLSYGHGKLGSFFANDMEGRSDNRECLWAYSAAGRAVERNIRVPNGGCPKVSRHASGTEVAVWQGAAMAVVMTASGMAYCWGGGYTGLEARITGEILKGVAGMRREKANELVKAIVAMIDAEMARTPAPRLKTFPELYDLQRLRPRPAFVAACSSAVEKLAAVGLPVSNRLVLN